MRKNNESYMQAAIKGAASWLIKKIIPLDIQQDIAEDIYSGNKTSAQSETKVDPIEKAPIGLLPLQVEVIKSKDDVVESSKFSYGSKAIGGAAIGYVRVLSELAKHIPTDTLFKIAEDLYLLSDKKMGAYASDIQAASEFLGLIALKRKEKGQ